MAIHNPIEDAAWATNFKIANGENANADNLNRAVDGLRLDVKDLFYKIYGGTSTAPAGSPAEPENAIQFKVLDGGTFGP